MTNVRVALLLTAGLVAGCGDSSFRALSPPVCRSNVTQGQQATSSDAFVDSICANVFIAIYPEKIDLLTQTVADVGFRYVGNYYRFKPELLAPIVSVGARLQVTVDSLVPDVVAFAKGIGGLDTLALELATSPPTDPAALSVWGGELDAYMQASARALKADPATRAIRLVGSNLANKAPALKINLEQSVDFGSVNTWNETNPGSATLDEWIAKARVNYPTKPLMVGQVGYSLRRFSAVVQAKYLPRVFLEHAKRGIARTCFDYLTEDAVDDSDLGVIDGAGVPRPALKTISNLMKSIEAQGGPAFSPGRLAYSLSAGPQVHQLLLQGPSGTFFLVVWLEVPSTDEDAFESAVIQFTKPMANVVAHRIDSPDKVVVRAKDVARIELKVPDVPVVIAITPGC